MSSQASAQLPDRFIPSPWDKAVLGSDAYEIIEPCIDDLKLASETPGHYTVRMMPLADAVELYRHGFYYCGTALEPVCRREHFLGQPDPAAEVTVDVSLDQVLEIADGAFVHGRFHRDFMVPREAADARYETWLRSLHQAGHVYGMLYNGSLAAFMAANQGHLILHAVAPAFRGRGLARSLWTPFCEALFHAGVAELTSSISAANVAAVNLCTSLGFRFGRAVDVYHRLTKA